MLSRAAGQPTASTEETVGGDSAAAAAEHDPFAAAEESAFAFGAEAEGADAQPDVAAEQVNPVKKEEGGEVDVDDAGETSGFAFTETEPADDTVQPEASGIAFAAADAEGNEDMDS